MPLSHGVNMTERRTIKASDKADRKSRYVLLVDNDVDTLSYTAMLLQRFDYRIRTAANVAEALKTAPGVALSLIITSFGLKDAEGLDLMWKLKQSPGLADVPFIVLVQHDDLLGEIQSVELGAAACLSWPVSPELLYQAVQAAVETRPRTCIRLRTFLPVEVNNLSLDYLDGTCTSMLSERGMFMRTATPFEVNTRLSLEIDLRDQTIVVDAVVLYSHRTAKGPCREPGMGLEFVRIEPNDQEHIRQFIRNEVTQGIAPGNA